MLKRLVAILLFTFLCLNGTQAQTSLNALRIQDAIKIDGQLSEDIWDQAEVAANFTTWQPVPGKSSINKTEAKILYDDNAIYIGAFLEADKREDIQTQLTNRDNVGNTDFFGFAIDTYGNGTSGFEFILGATGVQFDAKLSSSNENQEDPSWNAVWQSEVYLTDNGWYVEMRIPFSAIRFPNATEQPWRFNFFRYIAKEGERSSYAPIDLQKNGFINQFGKLNGVRDIKAPLRLSLSPYITGYVQQYNDRTNISRGFTYNGGMDLKYGINDAFTLDMTLIPDFGQTQSDDRVLNLSPFEVQYDENRDFFTEGLELFNRGGLFYSRRVGGSPIGQYDVSFKENTEEIIENPNVTQLYNATKVSGRTKKGLGIGVFNAIAGASNAIIKHKISGEKRKIETSPLTNYNLLVFDQNLPNNSYFSITNSNVYRRSKKYHNANVTATEFQLINKRQSHAIDGLLSYSQLLHKEADNVNGLQYELQVSKISGKYRLWMSHEGVSPNYNHNDLGFFTQSNYKDYALGGNIQYTNGLGPFNRLNIWCNASVQTTFEKNKFTLFHLNTGFWGQSKNLWSYNMWSNYEPYEIDLFEARTAGQIVKIPGFVNQGWNIGTDRRKKLSANLNLFGSRYFKHKGWRFRIGVSPNYRFSDKLSMSINTSWQTNNNLVGFVGKNEQNKPIMGLRDRVNVQNVFRTNYTFNNKMALSIRLRHDWNSVSYDSFHGLDKDGELTSMTMTQNRDFEFNYFNIDLNYSWRFAPGSDLIFVWKQSVAGRHVLQDNEIGQRNYFTGLSSLNELPQNDNISLRLVYYLDTQRFL